MISFSPSASLLCGTFTALLLPSISFAQNTFDIDDDAPPWWVDTIFFFWIFWIHIYYAYKFTDYALDHIHRELAEKEEADMYFNEAQSKRAASAGAASLDPMSPDALASPGSTRHTQSHHMNVGYVGMKKTRSDSTNFGGSAASPRFSTASQADAVATVPSKASIAGTSDMDVIAERANNVQTPTTDGQAAEGLGLGSLDDLDAQDPKNETNGKETSAGAGVSPRLDRNESTFNGSEREDSHSMLKSSGRESVRLELEDVHLNDAQIEITVDYVTLARPLTGAPNKFCCLFNWSHLLFSWSRTFAIRFFLRIYVLLACSLALVLWVEVFANTVLEYAITCYLRADEGYWLGFFLLPFLIYVLQVLLRYSWHALLIGWHMGSDKNGDIEALDNKRLKKAIKKLKSETKRMLRKQKRLYKKMRQQSLQMIKQESMDRVKSVSASANVTDNEAETSVAELVVDGQDQEKTGTGQQNESTLDAFKDLFEFDASKVEKQLKKAIRKHQAVIVGDFFVGTCWRLQLAAATIGMSILAAFTRDLTLFYQYLMRYMAAAGLSWCVVYFFFAVFISYYARLGTWNRAHPEIPIWVFFLLSDASDYDLGFERDLWVIVKISVAIGTILLGLLAFALGGAYDGEDGSGYFYFCGWTLIFYYLANLQQTCKPFAVSALWRDEMPNPSNAFLDEQKRIAYAMQLFAIKEEEKALTLGGGGDSMYGSFGDSPYSAEESESHANKELNDANGTLANTHQNSAASMVANEEVWSPKNKKKSGDAVPQIELPQLDVSKDDEDATAKQEEEQVAPVTPLAVESEENGVVAQKVEKTEKPQQAQEMEQKEKQKEPKQQKTKQLKAANNTKANKLAPKKPKAGAHKKLLKNQKSFASLQKYWETQQKRNGTEEEESPDSPKDSKPKGQRRVNTLSEQEDEFFSRVMEGVGGLGDSSESEEEEVISAKDKYELEREKLKQARKQRLEERRRKEEKRAKRLAAKNAKRNKNVKNLQQANNLAAPLASDASGASAGSDAAGAEEKQNQQPNITAAGSGSVVDDLLNVEMPDIADDAKDAEDDQIRPDGPDTVDAPYEPDLEDEDDTDAAAAAEAQAGAEEEIDGNQTTLDMDEVGGLMGNMAAQADEMADENEEEMIDMKTFRVYSEYGRFTLRTVEGFEFGEILDTDEKYRGLLESESKRRHFYGKGLLYKNKFGNVFHNYQNYWLDIYRPYDEYDVDRNVVDTGFLYGFGYCKTWARSAKSGHKKVKKRKDEKTFKERASKWGARCLGWSLDHLCNLLLAILALGILLTLYYFSSTLELKKPGDAESDFEFDESVFVNGSNYTSSSSSADSNVSNSSVATVQHYTMCDTIWEDSEHIAQLSVLDVVALTKMVYEQKARYDLNQMIRFYFDDEYEVIARRDVEPVFFHMRHKTAAIDYLVVRGTSSAHDMLQDVSLFIEVTGFQLLSWVFPFLNALPTGFIRTIVSYASFAEGMINQQARTSFGDVVEKYAKEYLSEIEYDTTLWVVGHSLGGAVSQIVSAKLYESEEFTGSYIASFGLNSPGTLYSSAKFGFEPSSLQLTSSTLASEKDLVSAVDEHSGNFQEVACRTDTVFECHFVRTTLCEMVKHCPSDTAKNPDVMDNFCNNEDFNFLFGAVLGVQNTSSSNFNITYETPWQTLIDVTNDTRSFE